MLTNQKYRFSPRPINVYIRDTANTIIASGAYTSPGSYSFTFTPSSSSSDYTLEYYVVDASGLCNFRVDNISISSPSTTYITVCDTLNAGDYRYGFGSHEKDDEVKGSGNHYSFGDYGYDPRGARRWNIDPMANEYSWQSPYATFNNNPIFYIDPLGLEGENPNEYTPEGAPKNPTEGEDYTASNGHTWTWITNDDGKSGWHRFDGEIKGVTIYPKEVKEAFQKDYERIQKNRTSIIGQLLGDGSAWKGAIPKGHSIYYNSPEMEKKYAKTRENHKALEGFVTGYASASLVAPFAGAALTTTGAFGVATNLSIKSFALKAGASALVQRIVNDGKINLAGVLADGTLGFGASALISSGIEANVDFKKRNFEFNTLGNGINPKQFLYNSSVNMFFGAKSDFLGNQMNAGGVNHLLSDGISNSLYQFSSNGLSNAYDKK